LLKFEFIAAIWNVTVQQFGCTNVTEILKWDSYMRKD